MSSTTPGPSPDAAFTPIASTILHLASDIFNSFRTLSAGTSDIEEPGLRLRIQARRFAEWAREWGVREEGGHEYAQTRAQIDRVARGAEDIREMLEQVVDCLGDVFYSGGMFGLLPASTADGATVSDGRILGGIFNLATSRCANGIIRSTMPSVDCRASPSPRSRPRSARK